MGDRLSGELSAPRAPVSELTFDGGDLGAIRAALSRWAAREGLDADRTHELVLAVNELATNSVSHGGGTGTLALWREGDTLMCDVRDGGRIRDPTVGSTRPGPDETGGRGLWLANQLCDAVEIRSGPRETVVRVHKRRAPL